MTQYSIRPKRSAIRALSAFDDA